MWKTVGHWFNIVQGLFEEMFKEVLVGCDVNTCGDCAYEQPNFN